MASNEAAVTGAGDEVASGRSHYWLTSQQIRFLAAKYKHFGGKTKYNININKICTYKQKLMSRAYFFPLRRFIYG